MADDVHSYYSNYSCIWALHILRLPSDKVDGQPKQKKDIHPASKLFINFFFKKKHDFNDDDDDPHEFVAFSK